MAGGGSPSEGEGEGSHPSPGSEDASLKATGVLVNEESVLPLCGGQSSPHVRVAGDGPTWGLVYEQGHRHQAGLGWNPGSVTSCVTSRVSGDTDSSEPGPRAGCHAGVKTTLLLLPPRLPLPEPQLGTRPRSAPLQVLPHAIF